MTNSTKNWAGRLPGLGADASVVFARFPVPAALMAIFTLLFIVFKDDLSSSEYENIGRLLVGLVIAAYLTVTLSLIKETRGGGKNLAAQIAAAAMICALAWGSKGLKLNLPMAVGAVILILGNSVRWRLKRDDLHVWDFTHKLWTGAVFAAVGSVIFAAGLAAITAALKILFGINVDDFVVDFLLPLGFGLLAPLYWMATLPPVDEPYSDLYESPQFVSKALAFLGTWLLSPLTLIYALILLAYGVKIILAGELPKGEIAQLTTPFLLVGTLTWLVLDPPFSKDKTLAKIFRRLWWPVSIPAALLLCAATTVRLAEYGITPKRLLLAGLVLWSLGLALWFTFAPSARRDIRLIPGGAAALLLAGTVSAGWLSYANQGARFENGLIASGIMESNGTLTPSPVITDMAAARKAKGALQYLMQHHGGKTKVAQVLSGMSPAFDPKKTALTSVYKALGLDEVKLRSRWAAGEKITYRRAADTPVMMTQFDKIYGPHDVHSHDKTKEKNVSVVFDNSGLKVTQAGSQLTFTAPSQDANFDFKNWIDDQKFASGPLTETQPSLTIIETETEHVSIVIQYFSRSGPNTPNEYTNFSFYTLTRGIDEGLDKAADEAND